MINRFALGSGGAALSDPFNPFSPSPAQTKLETQENYWVLDDSNWDLDGTGHMNAVMELNVGPTEMNNIYLNEAGLQVDPFPYTKAYPTPYETNPNAGEPLLFAYYTFPTLYKQEGWAITFRWTIYF